MTITRTPNTENSVPDVHVCWDFDPDCAAHMFYSDPENQKPAGPGRRRKSPEAGSL